MEKFVYQENEIKIARTQCGLCMFADPNSETVCQQYDCKPQEVLEGKVKCPHLRTKTLLDL